MIWIIVAAVSALGGFVQAFTGFGAGTMLMMVLPYAFTMLESPAVTQIICTVLAASMVWRFRRSIRLKSMVLPTLLYGAASLAVVPLAKTLDLRLLTLVFGCFLVVLSLYSLFFSRRTEVSGSTGALIVCSALSGVLSGLFGVGGPTMALYLVSVTRDREEYLGNLQLLFLLTNLALTVSRVANGLLTVSLLPICGVGMAAILVGKHFGYRVGSRLDAEKTCRVVYIAVGISGFITILQQTVLR